VIAQGVKKRQMPELQGTLLQQDPEVTQI